MGEIRGEILDTGPADIATKLRLRYRKPRNTMERVFSRFVGRNTRDLKFDGAFRPERKVNYDADRLSL